MSRRRTKQTVALTTSQRLYIADIVTKLPTARHHSFVIRVENKLALHGGPSVSDRLLTDICRRTLDEVL